MQDRQKIGEILVQLKVMSRLDVDRVLEAMQRRRRRLKFGQTAHDMGLLDEEHILAALAVQMKLAPGIDRFSLGQVLEFLQTAEAEILKGARPRRRAVTLFPQSPEPSSGGFSAGVSASAPPSGDAHTDRLPLL